MTGDLSNFPVLINMIAIINSVILSFILITKKPQVWANILLALVVIIPSFALLFNTTIYFGYYNASLLSMPFSFVLNYLWGPIFYFYVLIITQQWKGLSRFSILHALPAVVVFILCIPVFRFNENERITFFKTVQNGHIPLHLMILNTGMLFQVLFYLGISFFKLRQYKKTIKNIFSEIEKLRLNWLGMFIVLSIALWLIVMVLFSFFQHFVFLISVLPLCTASIYVLIVYKSITSL